MIKPPDLPIGKRCVVRDETSPSSFSTVDRIDDNTYITKHLQYGEMPFLLIGGFGNMSKKDG